MGCPLLCGALCGADVHADLDLCGSHCHLSDCSWRIYLLQVDTISCCWWPNVVILVMAKQRFTFKQKIGSRRLIGAVLLMHSHSTLLSAVSRLHEKHFCFECFINNFDPFLSLFFDIARKSLTTPSMWKTSGPKYWLASSKHSSHQRRQQRTPF